MLPLPLWMSNDEPGPGQILAAPSSGHAAANGFMIGCARQNFDILPAMRDPEMHGAAQLLPIFRTNHPTRAVGLEP